MVLNKLKASVGDHSKSIIFYFLLLSYGIIFCLISLVNHYNFRTAAYDLGINNNALYDYAHFRVNDCMIMVPQFTNVLSDHFSLYPMLVSPFSWIFGSYTMLVFQIFAILFGGIGIYRLILDKSKNEGLALTAMCHFFSVWGIYSALSFDYHDNVAAAMFVSWLFVFFFRKAWLPFFLFFALILISKENMALWMVFICVGLFFISFKEKTSRYVALASCAIALLYFGLIVKVVIPALANEGREYVHLHYKALGGSFEEILWSILTQPKRTFELLFVNQTRLPEYDTIKVELHFMVLLAGGYAFFKKPFFLLMLIPIYAQKMFNDDMGKWGINGHYSIEFVPIITVALYWWLSENSHRFAQIGSVLALLLCMVSTGMSFESRYSKWYHSELVRFYDKEHYQTEHSVSAIHQHLRLIPDEATVSAGYHLIPHLCFRDYIYDYPNAKDKVDYIALMQERETYPFSPEELQKQIEELSHSPQWETICAKDGVFIFKKK